MRTRLLTDRTSPWHTALLLFPIWACAEEPAAKPVADQSPTAGVPIPSSGAPDALPAANRSAAARLPDGPSNDFALWRGNFDEQAASRGLDYQNRSGEQHKPTVLEAGGAGVAVLDLGRDGDLDLAFGQGVESLAALVAGPGADLALYLNDGKADFSAGSGPGLRGWWTALAAGDVTGDGATDLVVGGFGDLALLLQDEHGALVRAERPELSPPPGGRLIPGAERSPGRFPLWTTGLALFDANRDGELDLYVGQYLDLDPVDPPLGSLGEGALEFPCLWKGQTVYCGPRGLKPQPDRLLLGRGAGQFEDVTATGLPGLEPGFTLAVAAFDADGDGDSDLYVANDSVPNRLFINDGSGRFSDFGAQAGVAVDGDGSAQAGMGIAFGDVDRDGVFDLALTNFSGEATELYFGAAVGFRPQTHRVGLGRASSRLLSWGVHLIDFDGDSRLDLFTANGHVYPQADAEFTGTHYAQADSLWTLAPGRPVTAVKLSGERSILAIEAVSRGSAVADFDGDGAPDLVLTTLDGPALLAMNQTAPASGRGNRLSVLCLGPEQPRPGTSGFRTPRDGTGTRVVVHPAIQPESGPAELLVAEVLVAEVQRSGSYQSSSTPWLHFGLGNADRYESIEVYWPSGRLEKLPAGAAGRALVLREGAGVIAEQRWP